MHVFCTDVIHEGHLNILNESNKYGDVTVGILSDSTMIKYNYFPTISIEERKIIIKETGLASDVIIQDEVMYDNVISQIKPDYVIHGDN